MKNKLLISILVSIVVSTNSVTEAQNLAAYVDYAGKFRVFDAGVYTQLDYMKPKDYVVGGNYVAFISYGNMLKFYYQGKIYELNEGSFVNKMLASKCLFAFTMAQQLNVVFNNKNEMLTTWCTGLRISDSLLVYHNGLDKRYYIFYNGQKYPLDDMYSGDTDLFPTSAIGQNIFMYVNSSKQMKIFYRGLFIDLPMYSPDMSFSAGLDIICGTNSNTQRFVCFFKGSAFDLESFIPQSYKVGHGMVAYISDDGSFKVFYRGKLKTLDSYAPLKYDVTDSIVTWVDGSNYFKLFYDGEVYTLENYEPKTYSAADGSMAYIDQLRRLKLFKNGKVTTITTEIIESFNLYGNLLQYYVGLDESKFYFDGQTY